MRDHTSFLFFFFGGACPCSRDATFTGDRVIGVVDFTSMLIKDHVLQHWSTNIEFSYPIQPAKERKKPKVETSTYQFQT
jgi:hypothetical protein